MILSVRLGYARGVDVTQHSDKPRVTCGRCGGVVRTYFRIAPTQNPALQRRYLGAECENCREEGLVVEAILTNDRPLSAWRWLEREVLLAYQEAAETGGERRGVKCIRSAESFQR